MSEERRRIGIVAHFAFGALAGGRGGHVGGVERQTSVLARWLAARGHEVSMITWDEGQQDGVEIDGVRVLKTCPREAGVPGLRFFTPRWTSLFGALGRADADIYYQNCAEYVTGQVALWCRWRRRKFVYSVASDPDCDPRLPELRSRRERALYRYGLAKADRIVVQTHAQQAALREGFGLESTVLPGPCPGPGEAEYEAPAAPEPGATARVLWAARISPEKGLERLLDLAALMPEVAFDLCGPADAPSGYVEPLLARASALPNVTYFGRVAREEMPAHYRRAALLVQTSSIDGFPNTFLEAWSHGIPVVAARDPDGLIALRGLGAVAEDTPGLARAMRALLASPERWRRASAAARRYYVENHTPEAALPRFEQVFLEACGAHALAEGSSS